MSLAHICTKVVPTVENFQKEGIFERLSFHETGLAKMVLSEVGPTDYEPIRSLEILSVQADLDISDLLALLRNRGRKPVCFWQLLLLAGIEDYKSFYSVSALGSIQEHGMRNDEMLISVPSLSLYQTIAAAKEAEARISQGDPKRDTMIENIRRSRAIGSEFRNRYNTRNMQIAVIC